MTDHVRKVLAALLAFLALLPLLAALPACRPLQPIVTTRVDTVAIERRTIDTCLVIQRDTARLVTVIDCDSLGNARLRSATTANGRRAAIRHAATSNPDGSITIDCQAVIDSLTLQVRLLEQRSRTIATTQTTTPQRSPWLANMTPFRAALPWILVVLLLLLLLLSLLRR